MLDALSGLQKFRQDKWSVICSVCRVLRAGIVLTCGKHVQEKRFGPIQLV